MSAGTTSAAPPGSMTITDAARLALDHLRAGRAAEAERLSRAILDAVPNQGEVLQLLGVAVMLQNRPQEAETVLRQAISVRPDLPDSHGNLGTVLQSLGRMGEALAAHDRCVLLSPASPEAYVNRGSARLALGDRNGAAADFARALRLCVAEVARDLLLGVAPLLVPDDHHRLVAIRRKPGHDGRVVGEATVAVNLGEPGPEARDVVERVRTLRVSRHEHALPGRETREDVLPHLSRTPLQPLDLGNAIGRARLSLQLLDFLQVGGDGLLELEGVHGHVGQVTAV